MTNEQIIDRLEGMLRFTSNLCSNEVNSLIKANNKSIDDLVRDIKEEK